VNAAAIGRDLARAFDMVGATFPFAVGLAFACAGLQLFGTWALYAAADLVLAHDAGELPATILAVWLHAMFIVAVSARAADPVERVSRTLFRAAVSGGTILAAPVLLFALLDAAGSSMLCADGKVWRNEIVPDWPWLWIGWLSLALLGVPARVLNVIGQRGRPHRLPLSPRHSSGSGGSAYLAARYNLPSSCDQLRSASQLRPVRRRAYSAALAGSVLVRVEFHSAIHAAATLFAEAS
jgi:hypothetical protein